jgi:hypothetical protein
MWMVRKNLDVCLGAGETWKGRKNRDMWRCKYNFALSLSQCSVTLTIFRRININEVIMRTAQSSMPSSDSKITYLINYLPLE